MNTYKEDKKRILNEKIKDSAGIYEIKCLVNDRIYIGSSNSINRRFKIHKLDLTNNNHHNNRLQQDFNKYGISNFNFKIIEVLKKYTRDKLYDKEQYYIDNNNPFYNIDRTVNRVYFIKKEQIITQIVIKKTTKFILHGEVLKPNKISRLKEGMKGSDLVKQMRKSKDAEIRNQWNEKNGVNFNPKKPKKKKKNKSVKLYFSKKLSRRQ